MFKFVNNHFNPFPVLGEILRIFPDGILWGVGFFSVLTLSYPFGIMFVALVESLLLYHGIHSLNTYLGVFTDNSTDKSVSSLACKTGFTGVTLQTLSLFGLHKGFAFPSAPIYIVSVVLSYIISTMIVFKRDLESLGIDYSSRLYLSSIGLSSLFIAFILFRSYNECDTVFNILVSAMVGLVVGALILEQNKNILGKEGVNILGIPILYGRTASGESLYVCNQPVA